jgi:hypothetical protein
MRCSSSMIWRRRATARAATMGGINLLNMPPPP